jgi:hypothetical protein
VGNVLLQRLVCIGKIAGFAISRPKGPAHTKNLPDRKILTIGITEIGKIYIAAPEKGFVKGNISVEWFACEVV